jgi:DNA-binding LacI/PurR family transcriptional regulator
MRSLLKNGPDLDAVFASSDQIALGALGALHQSGLRIPQDMAVVGFDNVPEAPYFWPPLSTIYQHLVDIGCLAVQNLHKMIEAARYEEKTVEKTTTIISPELIVRASSSQF